MNLLLITGAIDIKPYCVPNTSICDTQERLAQYVNCIEYAIDNYKSITHIVFCENTNFRYDYSLLTERALSKGKILEILSFTGTYDKIIKFGKGFGEGEIIGFALKTSAYIPLFNSFFKLTGRLIVRNMETIIKTTSHSSAFIFNPKEICNKQKNHIETFFYKSDVALYKKELADACLLVDEHKNTYLEHIFYERLKDLKIRCFNMVPAISGLSGTTGNSYDRIGLDGFVTKLYFKTGVYNLSKTFPEKFFTLILTCLLKVKRVIKQKI
jgi:hypothetical protein